MNIFSHPRFLPIYSGVLTFAFVAVVVAAFFQRHKSPTFDEIDVQRINVREPDGTLRLIIANNARFPGLPLHGKEYPHADRDEHHIAGMIFLDGEGSESGGLIFGGEKAADGKVVRIGHLSFDRYDQDQTVNLEGGDEDGKYYAGLSLNDQPDWPLTDFLDFERAFQALAPSERAAAKQAFETSHPAGKRRAYIGRKSDSSSVMELRDEQGRLRLVAKVAEDGTPTLQVLDQEGVVTAQWPQAKTP